MSRLAMPSLTSLIMSMMAQTARNAPQLISKTLINELIYYDNMVVGELSINTLTNIVAELGKIGLWLKTVGIIFVLWVIFQSVELFINTKRMKEILEIKEDVARIERKLNKVLKK